MVGSNYTEDPRQITRQLKWYPLLAMLFVALFLVVNVVTQKIVPLGSKMVLTAGDVIYPLLYLVSLLITEVYGYALSRRVIWWSFLCNLVMVLLINGAVLLPAAAEWHEQAAFAVILGRSSRLLIASLSAFLIGEFLSAYVLARFKVLTAGRYLWLRSSLATLGGQLIDSVLFTTVAFWGEVELYTIFLLSCAAYGCKIFYQIVLTPLIYWIARNLKRSERIDIYDRNTHFNPFNLGLK